MKTYELLLRYGIAETAKQTGLDESTLRSIVDQRLKVESTTETEKAKLMHDFKRKLVEKVKKWRVVHAIAMLPEDVKMCDMFIDLITQEDEPIYQNTLFLCKKCGNQVPMKNMKEYGVCDMCNPDFK